MDLGIYLHTGFPKFYFTLEESSDCIIARHVNPRFGKFVLESEYPPLNLGKIEEAEKSEFIQLIGKFRKKVGELSDLVKPDTN